MGTKNKENNYFHIILSSVRKAEEQKECYNIEILTETKKTTMKMNCITDKEEIKSFSLIRYIKEEHGDKGFPIKMPKEIILKSSLDNFSGSLYEWLDNKSYLDIDQKSLFDSCCLISKEIKQEIGKIFPKPGFLKIFNKKQLNLF